MKTASKKGPAIATPVEEYAEVVGDLDSWAVDEELSFPARSGKHAAPGTQILIELDANQAALVMRAADARGVDPVRFAKETLLDAARALTAPAGDSDR